MPRIDCFELTQHDNGRPVDCKCPTYGAGASGCYHTLELGAPGFSTYNNYGAYVVEVDDFRQTQGGPMCFSQYTTIDELIPCGLKSFPTVVGNPCTLPSHGVCSDQCVSHADCNKGLDFDAPDAEREYCGEQCIYIYLSFICIRRSLHQITSQYTILNLLGYTQPPKICVMHWTTMACVSTKLQSLCVRSWNCAFKEKTLWTANVPTTMRRSQGEFV
jgi:hypothetical protein